MRMPIASDSSGAGAVLKAQPVAGWPTRQAPLAPGRLRRCQVELGAGVDRLGLVMRRQLGICGSILLNQAAQFSGCPPLIRDQ